MDDAVTKFLKLIWIPLCLVLVAPAFAADLTYVTPAEVDRLQEKFAAAHLKAEDVTRVIDTKGWRCDLYGVRTRLQVRRDVDVYRFERLIPTADLKNSGAQPISTYRVSDDALKGSGEHGLVDEVRLTSENELIAKLTIPERGVTVAYTLCHGS